MRYRLFKVKFALDNDEARLAVARGDAPYMIAAGSIDDVTSRMDKIRSIRYIEDIGEVEVLEEISNLETIAAAVK